MSHSYETPLQGKRSSPCSASVVPRGLKQVVCSVCVTHALCSFKEVCEAQFIPICQAPPCFLDTSCRRSKTFPGMQTLQRHVDKKQDCQDAPYW